MNPTDLALIDSLTTNNPELDRLMARHREYESQLGVMARKRWLSPADERELKRLKQLKLAGRDRIEAILAEHRA